MYIYNALYTKKGICAHSYATVGLLQARGMQTSTDQRHLHVVLTAYASDMLDILGSGVSYGEWWKTSLWAETYLYQQQLPIVILDSEHEFKFYVQLFSRFS